MNVFLPSVEGECRVTVCLICGAVPASPDPDELEFRMPNGMISMSVADDLCLECAVHFWRALKEILMAEGLQATAHNALARYSVTAEAMKAQGFNPKGKGLIQ